ncbi:MAG: hypothetical protein R3B91_23375 [Planctomycetaceae bacterium]
MFRERDESTFQNCEIIGHSFGNWRAGDRKREIRQNIRYTSFCDLMEHLDGFASLPAINDFTRLNSPKSLKTLWNVCMLTPSLRTTVTSVALFVGHIQVVERVGARAEEDSMPVASVARADS